MEEDLDFEITVEELEEKLDLTTVECPPCELVEIVV